jgi:hypothetical protein
MDNVLLPVCKHDVAAEGIGTDSYDFGRLHQHRMNVLSNARALLHTLTVAPVLPISTEPQLGELFMEPLAVSLVNARRLAHRTLS